MPRTLSTALQTAVSSPNIKTAFLVNLQLSTDIRLTDWYSNITYESQDYEAGGSFLTIDSITETGKLQVDQVNIGFSNVTDQVRSLIENKAFTDKKVEIHLAYFDANDSLIGAISFFTGYIRNVAVQEDLKESIIKLTVASHWSNWGLIKGRTFTDEAQQKFSSGDKGFEFCTQIKDDVRWGK
tara:strand:+ start:130 stop:678 length:549 start_codon:yes stop_codon:yes gene_type:complete